MAWRNVMRQKVRTGLTVSAITFCTFSLLMMMAFARGGHQQMIQSAVSMFTGHFQIQVEGYLEDPTLYKSFELPEELISKISRQDKVRGVAPRIVGGGLVSTEMNTTGGMIAGVDPAREFEATTLLRSPREGERLKPGDRDKAMLGRGLAENLEVGVGDEVQLMIQSYYGSLELGFFEVTGIVDTGNPELDRAMIVIPLERMQSLFEMEGLVTEVAVVLETERAKEELMEFVRRSLPGSGRSELAVVPWEEVLPELVELLFLDNAGGVLYMAILVVVVAFIVLLTITMSVMERVKEFGVLMAIGIRPRRVFMTIMIECFIIGVMGIAIGLALGTVPSWYWSVHPIELSGWAEAAEQFGMRPVIKTILMPAMYWGSALIMLVITVLSSVFPALRAARISPADAMRHV